MAKTRKEKVKPSSREHLSCAGGTHIGLKRKVNEDSWVIAGTDEDGHGIAGLGIMCAVADGLGGHSGGHIASKIACDKVHSYFRKENFSGKHRPMIKAFRKELSALVGEIDRNIREESQKNDSLEDMATTLSVLMIMGREAVVVHVGDSRIYRLRRGRLTQLTQDHTFVQEMIDEGEITPEDVDKHPLRNMLTSALGTEEPLETYFADTFSVEPGDWYLLCSDGLTHMVSDQALEDIMSAGSNPKEMVGQLIEAALANGGKDNVTAIVVTMLH